MSAPRFLGNERISEMENGSFEVVSKTFSSEALFPEWSFSPNGREWAERAMKTDVSL